MKRISAEAYGALNDSLASGTWFKRTYQRWVQTLFRDHPELTAGLNLDGTKREASDELVHRLQQREGQLQQFIAQVMLEIAESPDSEDFNRMQDRAQGAEQRAKSQRDKARLKRATAAFADDMAAQARLDIERAAAATRAAEASRWDQLQAELMAQFQELNAIANPQKRGYTFEAFLHGLLSAYGMEPRLAYSTETEQIDGAFEFNTDGFILEAKFIKTPVSREQVDSFKAKVDRKGKNTLGLYVAVNGFSRPALADHRTGATFLTMDGGDLYAVLDRRIRLDDLLSAKRRHAVETGSCYRPVHEVLGG